MYQQYNGKDPKVPAGSISASTAIEAASNLAALAGAIALGGAAVAASPALVALGAAAIVGSAALGVAALAVDGTINSLAPSGHGRVTTTIVKIRSYRKPLSHSRPGKRHGTA